MFILFLYISKLVSPSEYGIVGIVQNIISISISIVSLGLAGLIVIYFSSFNISEKEIYLKRILKSFHYSFFIFLIIAISLYGTSFLYELSLSNIERFFIFLIIILSVYLSFFNLLTVDILRIENKIPLLSKLIVLFSMISSLVVLIFVNTKVGFFALFFAALVANLGYFITYIKLYSRTFVFRHEKIVDSATLKISIPLMLSSLIIALIYGIDKWILGYFLTFDKVGIYEVSLKIGIMYDILLVQVFSAIYIPLFFKYINKNFKKMLRYNFLLIYLNLLFGFIIFYLLSNESFSIFQFLIGESFYDSLFYIKYVVIYFILFHSLSLLNLIFMFYKKTIYITYGMIYLIFMNLVFDYILIPKYGILGSFYASYIAILSLIIFWSSYFFYKKGKI